MVLKKDIQTLFDEFLIKIKDGALREKIISTWLDGCQQGKWETLEQLYLIPFTLLTETREIGFIAHTLVVTKSALELANAQLRYYRQMPYNINFDWLIAGGLLHDVGKLLEFEKDGQGGYRQSFSGKCARHPISGAILAAQNGLPLEVVNIIACHAKEGEGRAQRIETILIHQADFATFDPMVALEKGKLIV